MKKAKQNSKFYQSNRQHLQKKLGALEIPTVLCNVISSNITQPEHAIKLGGRHRHYWAAIPFHAPEFWSPLSYSTWEKMDLRQWAVSLLPSHNCPAPHALLLPLPLLLTIDKSKPETPPQGQGAWSHSISIRKEPQGWTNSQGCPNTNYRHIRIPTRRAC